MSYSIRESVASGLASPYSVPPYLMQSHIKVFKNGTLLSEGADYTWLDPSNIVLTVTPASGDIIKRQRVTPTDAMLTVQQPSVYSYLDANRSDNQLLYITQEQADTAAAVIPGVTNMIANVAALRLKTTAQLGGSMVYLTGYYDSTAYQYGKVLGAGWLVYDATGTELDDGIEVFRDLSGGRWKRARKAELTAGDAGVVGNGAADDTAAWNRVIAKINEGRRKRFVVEDGLDVRLSGNNHLITASGWYLGCGSMAAAKVTFTGAAGTAHTFLTCGDTLTTVQEWMVHGLTFNHLNKPLATAPLINAANARRGYVVNLQEDYGGTFIKTGLGGGSPVQAGQMYIAGNRLTADKSIAAAVFHLENISGSVLFDNRVGSSGSAAADPAFRGILLKPQVGGNIDSIYIERLIINLPGGNDIWYAGEVNGSFSDIGSVWWVQCNFELTIKGALHIHSNDGGTGFIRRMFFRDCRLNPISTQSGSKSIYIQNTNNVSMHIEFLDCPITVGNGQGLDFTGSASDTGRVLVLVKDCTFSDRRQGQGSPMRDVITVGASGLHLIGNTFVADKTQTDEQSLITGSTFRKAVVFTANVESYEIVDNDCMAITDPIAIDLTSITTAAGLMKRIIRGNKNCYNPLPHRVTTLSTAVTTIVSIPIPDESTAIIRVDGIVKQDNTNTASAYTLRAVVARNAGVLALVGTVDREMEKEQGADSDLQLTLNGANVDVTGQANNSLAFTLSADVDLKVAQ